jgi:hypothetical protein
MQRRRISNLRFGEKVIKSLVRWGDITDNLYDLATRRG